VSTYFISPKMQGFIESNFFEWSFEESDNFLPSKDDFLKITHPAELHFLAYIYNWDDDAIVLKWILESPLCSRATANLIFWRCLPSYFEQADFCDPTTCQNYCEAGFLLIPLVLSRYKEANFSSSDITFDPSSEKEPVSVKSGKWEVPAGVYDVINGIDIEVQLRGGAT
jgi:hypothetical protein